MQADFRSNQLRSLLSSTKKKWPRVAVIIIVLFLNVLVYYGHTYSFITCPSFIISMTSRAPPMKPNPNPNRLPPFTCQMQGTNRTCPPPPPAIFTSNETSPVCPEYFRWIHEDLRPWKRTGITKEMVEEAGNMATFRLVVVNGKAYFERYRGSVQPREMFTLWGFLQLLRRYPGRVPDVDLMFDCGDSPRVRASNYRPPKVPPALFHYCGASYSLDILFPDWSFWGWPNINIKPWDLLSKEMKEENKKNRWVDREPYSYWKGNPAMSKQRKHMVDTCNASAKQDWNAHLFVQNWRTETKQGFRNSDLSSQCTYRYKIYIEGIAWSVSQKYIMACDSPTLFVTAKHYEFFTRSLVPLQHYWPIKNVHDCKSIKFAVDWGNQHKEKAEAIGKEGSGFIMENLKMDYVYDYMLHLLNEYSKLLKFQPTVPPKAVEFCSETMACPEKGLTKDFMMKTMVNVSQSSNPCTLPPPFDPLELKATREKKLKLTKQVEIWERNDRQDQKM